MENRADSLFVRSYAPDDAPALSRILREAVIVTASRFYAPDQIAAWLSIAPDVERIRDIYASGRSAFVACHPSGEPVAFSDHDDTGHIFFLYCVPAAGGRGAAARLMDAVEGQRTAGRHRPAPFRGQRSGARLLPQAGLPTRPASRARDRWRQDPQPQGRAPAGEVGLSLQGRIRPNMDHQNHSARIRFVIQAQRLSCRRRIRSSRTRAVFPFWELFRDRRSTAAPNVSRTGPRASVQRAA